MQGLTFDSGSGTLYGTDATTRQLIRISTATGAGTAVGSTVRSVMGLGPRLP